MLPCHTRVVCGRETGAIESQKCLVAWSYPVTLNREIPVRTILPVNVLMGAVVLVTGSGWSGRGAEGDVGWESLFNGKDLTGWKMHPQPNKAISRVLPKMVDGKVVGYDAELAIGKTTDPSPQQPKIVTLWKVENGLLIGGGPASHLFTERGDFDNFHFRIEAKINDGGNSGQYFRTEFGPGFPKGYEAQINATHRDPVKTGSLYPNPGFGLAAFRDSICVLNTAPHRPDEFFVQEVIADGPTITIRVNGQQTVKWTDPDYRFKKGHFALQGHDPGSVMTFKRVEWKPIQK